MDCNVPPADGAPTQAEADQRGGIDHGNEVWGQGNKTGDCGRKTGRRLTGERVGKNRIDDGRKKNCDDTGTTDEQIASALRASR